MDLPQLTKILGAFPLFQGIEEGEWPALLEGHRFRNLPHHQTLYTAGENAETFSFVLTGAFKLVRPTPRGEDAIVYFATPGDVIGGLVMLKPAGTFPVSAIALGPSTVLVLPRSTYANGWARNAKVQLKLNSALYSRMSVLQEDKANAKLSLQKRIASFLLSLLSKQPAGSGKRLSIPLTRQEIADSVGSSVESVIRTMSEMSQNGLIHTEDKQIEILRADKIAELLKNP
jgi:CRP/FNR family transcriptional regulator